MGECMQPAAIKVSLVTTILNDREGCSDFLRQMELQTSIPDEIVMVDAGSKDGTWELLQNYRPARDYSLRVLQEIGCNIARGRNLAITKAKNDIIVSTDVGCIWEPLWLEELARPLLADNRFDAVMGSWMVRKEDLKGIWSKAEYALLNEPKLISTGISHSSSRSIAYRKSLWTAIGGYPEDLTLAADDMVFILLLHKLTDRVGYAPVPRCYWQRPVTLRSFIKETLRNFRGAGEAGIWHSYGIMVGGRLFLEILFCVLGSLFLFFPLLNRAGIFFLAALLALFGLRIARLVPAIQRFNSNECSSGWVIIPFFEYMVKFYGVLGYWRGFLYGYKHCKKCRDRLRGAKINLW